jgi:hypothetical protein
VCVRARALSLSLLRALTHTRVCVHGCHTLPRAHTYSHVCVRACFTPMHTRTRTHTHTVRRGRGMA